MAAGRWNFALFAWAALAASIGCSSQLADPPRDGGSDGAPSLDGGPADPATCGCRLEADQYTLDMSLSCLCSRYNCASAPPIVCGAAPDFRSWTLACGLTVFSNMTIGGLDVWAYDAAGNLVGVQLSSDVAEFACPSDPSMKASAVKAGRFPGAGCPAQACGCDAGVSCAAFAAPAAD